MNNKKLFLLFSLLFLSCTIKIFASKVQEISNNSQDNTSSSQNYINKALSSAANKFNYISALAKPLYDAPGNIAKFISDRTDGKIITGDQSSLKSASISFYNYMMNKDSSASLPMPIENKQAEQNSTPPLPTIIDISDANSQLHSQSLQLPSKTTSTAKNARLNQDEINAIDFSPLFVAKNTVKRGPLTLNNVRDKILTISQHQIDGQGNAFQTATGVIKSPTEYIDAYKGLDDNQKQTMLTKLNNYKSILDSRGDGNCGYRAALVSMYIEGMKNPALLTHLENLVKTKFSDLFKKYDDKFDAQDKDAASKALQNHLSTTLEKIKTCKRIDDIQSIINTDTTFDYGMIMFERYLMADIMNAESSPDLIAFLDTKINLATRISHVLKWQEELDQDTTAFLAKATGITINSIIRDQAYNQVIAPENQQSYGNAYILYVPGHYQILVPKDNALVIK